MTSTQKNFARLVRTFHKAAVQTDTAMRHMSPDEQAFHIGSFVDDMDCVIVIYPAPGRTLNKAMLVLKGQGALASLGFDLALKDKDGTILEMVPEAPLPDNRPPDVVALLADSFEGARFMEIAWGDSPYSNKCREEHRLDGGEAAIANMRAAATPAGRARLAKLAKLTKAHRSRSRH